jgi:hypothetical protein
MRLVVLVFLIACGKVADLPLAVRVELRRPVVASHRHRLSVGAEGNGSEGAGVSSQDVEAGAVGQCG